VGGGVAFQGEPGAFSELAVRCALGPEAEALPCRTLRDVFAAVAAGRAALGVVPVEYSRSGSVHETYDLLLEHWEDPLRVRGEVAVRVEHCLLAPAGTRLADVRRVYSHPQALAQCEGYLRRLGAEAVAVYDTAGGARDLAAGGEPGAAAVASARAAELYGLQVLAQGIQDDADNTTRFYVVGPPGPPVPAAPGEGPARGGRVRTVLVLALAADDSPGALFWALGTWAYWGVNISKIESRPSRLRPWHHQFYLELDVGADEPACVRAIAELRGRQAQVRVLGSFPGAGSPR
jgi:prephenate dehydratase